jgi:hypothetical protein
MKLPSFARDLTRKTIGSGSAPSITPEELHELAEHEPVVVIGVGIVRAGTTDTRLPGTQRVASLLSLSSVVADLPRQHAIALHCG